MPSDETEIDRLQFQVMQQGSGKYELSLVLYLADGTRETSRFPGEFETMKAAQDKIAETKAIMRQNGVELTQLRLVRVGGDA